MRLIPRIQREQGHQLLIPSRSSCAAPCRLKFPPQTHPPWLLARILSAFHIPSSTHRQTDTHPLESSHSYWAYSCAYQARVWGHSLAIPHAGKQTHTQHSTHRHAGKRARHFTHRHTRITLHAQPCRQTHSLPGGCWSSDKSLQKFMTILMKPPPPSKFGLNSSKYLSMGTASIMSFTNIPVHVCLCVYVCMWVCVCMCVCLQGRKRERERERARERERMHTCTTVQGGGALGKVVVWLSRGNHSQLLEIVANLASMQQTV